MLRKSDYCKEYKNGNITIKYDSDMIQKSKQDSVLTINVNSWKRGKWYDYFGNYRRRFLLSNYGDF